MSRMLLVMDTMYNNTFNAIIIITLLKITFYTKQNFGIIYNAQNHIQTKVFENANASTKFPRNRFHAPMASMWAPSAPTQVALAGMGSVQLQ